jgi:hypothetical protein
MTQSTEGGANAMAREVRSQPLASGDQRVVVGVLGGGSGGRAWFVGRTPYGGMS